MGNVPRLLPVAPSYDANERDRAARAERHEHALDDRPEPGVARMVRAQRELPRVGDADLYRERSRALDLAQHGRIVMIGYGSGTWPKIDPLHAVLKSYSLVGAFAGARTAAETRGQHAHLVQLAEAGKIRVPIDKVFDFDHVPQAIDRLAKGEMLGKVVVKI